MPCNIPEIRTINDKVQINTGDFLANVLLLPLTISIVLERSLEVFINAFRIAEKEAIELKISVLEQDIKRMEEEQANSSVKFEQKIEEKREKLNQCLINQIKYRSKTRKIAVFCGIIFGLLISFSGVRVLEFLTQGFVENFTENWIFIRIDLLLSAGLIAGGSEAFHQLMKVYTSVMNTTSHNVEQARQTPGS